MKKNSLRAGIKKLKNLLLVLLIAFQALIHAAPVLAATNSLELNFLVREAVDADPELRELSGNLAAARARELRETSLEDPMLGFALMNFPLNVPAFGTEMMTNWQIMISQRFPFPGRLDLRGTIARLNSAVNEANYLERLNRLKAEVKEGYFDLARINNEIKIVSKYIELLKAIAKISEARYSTGSGIQQEVVNAHVEVLKYRQRLIELNRDKNLAGLELRRRLNRKPVSVLGEPGELKLNHIHFSVPRLEETAATRNPGLVKAAYNIRAGEQQEQLAGLAYYPDFDFSLSYGMSPTRADMVSAQVSFPLPVWYKTRQSSEIREARAMTSASRQALENLRRNVSFDISRLVTEINSIQEIHSLLIEGIIPLARQGLDSAIANYQVGKTDLISVLQSLLSLYQLELDSLMHIAEHEKAVARLEAVVGAELVKR